MPTIDLKYDHAAVPFDYDEERFEVLAGATASEPLTDLEINSRLDTPIGSGPLEEMVQSGDSVLIVVPDATRQTGCGQIVNLLVRRLISSGTAAHDIRIIFATGIHRPVTEDEKAEILTPFIAQRIKTLDHDPRDLARLVRLGETSGGIAVELNRAVVEHDHVILIGGVSFHYFAGFTGGRKLICPGLGSARTISATHKLAFDCERMTRRDGVGPGLLDGNAVHEAFVAAVEMAAPAFAITTTVDGGGRVTNLTCGHWQTSHRTACDRYSEQNTVTISTKRDLVVASCGGSPHDINLIQAHKALDAASLACTDGGSIVLLAECADGLGRSDFIDWFDSNDSQALAEKLCQKYQVNGQTAWSLMKKTERFDVHLVSRLPDDAVKKMGMRPAATLDIAIEKAARNSSGYIIPAGAKMAVTTV